MVMSGVYFLICVSKCLYECYVFIEFLMDGCGGESIMIVGDFYKLYGVGWCCG